MKKISLFVMALFLGMFTFFGCKKTADVVLWHTMGKQNANIVQEELKRFTKKTGISVKLEQKGDYDALKSNISTALPAGNQPSLAFCYNDHIALYNQDNKRVKDLTEFINDPKVGFTAEEKADFVGAFYKEGSEFADGGFYSLPFAKSTEVLFYNKDVFDKKGYTVPRTWEEMDTLINKIKTDYSAEFAKEQKAAVYGYDSGANYLITLAQQQGLPFTGFVGEGEERKGEILFADGTQNAGWISLLKDLREKYKNKGFVTKATLSGSYTSTKFTTGQIFMSIGSTGGTKYNLPGDPNPEFNVGLAHVPYASAGLQKVIQQGPNILMFDNDEKENKKAWEVLKFLVSPEVTAKYSRKTGYVPPRKSAYELDFYKEFLQSGKQSSDPLQKAIVEALELSKEAGDSEFFYTSPAFDSSSSAREQIEKAFTVIITASDDAISKAPKAEIKDKSGSIVKTYTAGTIEAFIQNALEKAYIDATI